MTAKCRSLLDLAHYCPCTYDEPHDCNQWQGCEPAHGDALFTGRAFGRKSGDGAFAAICHNAHRLITAKVGDDMDRERKQGIWLRAHFKTWDFIIGAGWVTVNLTKARREGTVLAD